MPNLSYPRPYGAYVLLEPLGQGGMSEVELARRTVDESSFVRFLVIKRIRALHVEDESFIRMFQDEARINAELQHENIAQVYDFGRVNDEFFIAMEFVPGLDLRALQIKLANTGQTLPLNLALRIIIDLLAGLEYAHSRVDTFGKPMRIVHRDVNPRNVMLSVRGEVKLIDFGVAKADTRSHHTVGHAIKGKYAYMAPEQIDDTLRVDGRADLYAAGLLLHELVAGAHPLSGLNEVQIMHRVLAGELPELPFCHNFQPDSLRDVQQKALCTDRDQRFGSAEEMRRALIKSAEELGPLASSSALAAFVQDVSPDTGDGLSSKLKEYRAHATGGKQVNQARITKGEHSKPTLAKGNNQPSREASLSVSAPAKSPWKSLALIAAAVIITVLLAVSAISLFYIWQSNKANERVNAIPTPPTAKQLTGNEEATNDQGSNTDAPATTDTISKIATKPSNSPRPKKRSTKKSPPPSTETPPAGAPIVTPESSFATEDESTLDAQENDGSSHQNTTIDQAVTTAETASYSPSDEVTEIGFLFVSSKPTLGMQVWIDGERLGNTPIRNVEVSVGSHQVEIRDPNTGQSWTKEALINRNQPTIVTNE